MANNNDNEKDIQRQMENLTVENEYGTEQIDSLEGLEAVRKRPGMYIGSTSEKGVTHLVWEVADNSIDEFVAGHGKEVLVTVAKDATVTIRDFGRGIPTGPHHKWKNPDGTPMETLTGILTKLHAGGKFNAAGSGYKVSAGLHGVGAKAVNALSDLFIARVYRNGKILEQVFSKGEPMSDLEVVGDCDPSESGTEISYHPDKEIFKQTIYPNDKALQSRMDELASLNAGLAIVYKNEHTEYEETYLHEDGIIGYAKRLAQDKPLLYDDVIYFKGNYKLSDDRIIIVEIAFIHDDDDKGDQKVKTFANNINTHEGGFHEDGFRSAYRKKLNKFGEEKKLLKEKETLSINYLLEGINVVISVKVPEAEFEGQTKTKLGNAEAEDAVKAVFEASFDKIVKDKKYEDILESIIMKALKAKEADEAARKARSLVKQGNKVKKMALPGKLADCDPRSNYSEIYLVEGDSAGGSAKDGRDRYFQAILPLRGKVLNVEKSDLGKLLNSDAIRSIIAALGTGIDAPGQKFDIKKSRYDKVIIMTDADIDGAHIKTLLLTLFYNYMRPLIEEGYIYVAQPPLYRIEGKKEARYLQTDSELREYRKKHPNTKITRFKGLGEMNADQLWETTMDPAARTLVKVSIEDAARANEVFINLMGSDAQPRRDFIEANSYKVDLTFL